MYLSQAICFFLCFFQVKRIREHLKKPLRDYPSSEEEDSEGGESEEESEEDGSASPNSPDEPSTENPIVSNRPQGVVSAMSPQNDTTEVCERPKTRNFFVQKRFRKIFLFRKRFWTKKFLKNSRFLFVLLLV